ncbi:MAG TPA: hypothetical protein PLD14_02610 [Candidatus Pacearchaeota archaeon]|nr:hypothetical protein [Candidatus Pacearchaeota archaeon]HPR80093.1 hypothetical protein [Candidatus Pacearchaeota archaeon]
MTKETELDQLRKIRINDLQIGSRILLGISKLLEKNENVGIRLGMYDGGTSLFPPSGFKPKGGKISATVYMTDRCVDVYPPGTTCQIDLAYIGISNDGILSVEMRRFSPHWKHCPMFDKISQYNGPERQGRISLGEVEKIFSEIQNDIQEAFNLKR